MMKVIRDAREIFQQAVEAVQAPRLMGCLDEHPFLRTLGPQGRVYIVGAGKAALAMAAEAKRRIEAALGRPVDGGVVVVPHGYGRECPANMPAPVRVEVMEGSHPTPDAAGAEAARRALALAAGCRKDDLLLALISGGGSSLWPAFADGISLSDARELFQRLLHSGATIAEFNCVRKHLSRIGGGRLAAAAGEAHVLTLAISDVVGDDPATIASGPTVPDPTTFADARSVLEKYNLSQGMPASVAAHLRRGLADSGLDTPKPEDTNQDGRDYILLANNRRALEAARVTAERLGYCATIADEAVTGEAREAGQRLTREALEYARHNGGPACLIWGGETTVTVHGNGKGGRNQELVLGAALALGAAHENRGELVFLSGGTDGIDGPTDAAGAWATPRTVTEAAHVGLSLQSALERNDAYPLLEKIGALLITGPTHTNVMDIQVALIGF